MISIVHKLRENRNKKKQLKLWIRSSSIFKSPLDHQRNPPKFFTKLLFFWSPKSSLNPPKLPLFIGLLLGFHRLSKHTLPHFGTEVEKFLVAAVSFCQDFSNYLLNHCSALIPCCSANSWTCNFQILHSFVEFFEVSFWFSTYQNNK